MSRKYKVTGNEFNREIPRWAPQIGGTYESFEDIRVPKGHVILIEPNYKRNYTFPIGDITELFTEGGMVPSNSVVVSEDFQVEEDETSVTDEIPSKAYKLPDFSWIKRFPEDVAFLKLRRTARILAIQHLISKGEFVVAVIFERGNFELFVPEGTRFSNTLASGIYISLPEIKSVSNERDFWRIWTKDASYSTSVPQSFSG